MENYDESPGSDCNISLDQTDSSKTQNSETVLGRRNEGILNGDECYRSSFFVIELLEK